MKPDSKRHKNDPAYLRRMIEESEYSQNAVAEAIGISPRSIRYYLAGEKPIPYTVEFAIEALTDTEPSP